MNASESERPLSNLRIGLIGDHDPRVIAHRAIPGALAISAEGLSIEVAPEWLPTVTLNENVDRLLSAYDGLWCVPASPYESLEGALRAIRFARERGRPFLGTCGGFQHAVLEFARNVLHLKDADHAEINPEASCPLITPLKCSLVEQDGLIIPRTGTRLHAIVEGKPLTEQYHCSFGVNPQYLPQLEAHGLIISGSDESGDVRAIELEGHPFFFATLFQPERSALKNENHPLVTAFLSAALTSRIPEGDTTVANG